MEGRRGGGGVRARIARPASSSKVKARAAHRVTSMGGMDMALQVVSFLHDAAGIESDTVTAVPDAMEFERRTGPIGVFDYC